MPFYTALLIAIVIIAIIQTPSAIYTYRLLKKVNQPGWSQFIPFYSLYIQGRAGNVPRTALIAILAEIALIATFLTLVIITATTATEPGILGILLLIEFIVYIPARLKLRMAFVAKLKAANGR